MTIMQRIGSVHQQVDVLRMNFRSLTAIVLSSTVTLGGFASELHILLFHSGSGTVQYASAGVEGTTSVLPPAGMPGVLKRNARSHSVISHDGPGQPFFHPACPLNPNGSSFRLYFQETESIGRLTFQISLQTATRAHHTAYALIQTTHPRAPPFA